MSKKKKSQRNQVPVIPQLSPDALDEVQTIERYARRQLMECQNISHFNSPKAERILRTCAVQVLNTQIAYYKSLPIFHQKWTASLQADVIESAVGMIPRGYHDDLYAYFREVLWDTTDAELNRLKTLAARAEPRKAGSALADAIRGLRDECRLTTEELAEEISLDARSVQRHIAGKTQPYTRHLRAYEELFSKLLERKIVINKLS